MAHIVTAIIESNDFYDNSSRFKIIEEALKMTNNGDILLFPAGFIEYNNFSQFSSKKISSEISSILKKNNLNALVCFGVDTDEKENQLGIAVDQNGIVSLARKFYPTDDEFGIINSAESVTEKEEGFSRTFNWNGKNYFLAVCYDTFGISKQKLKNPDVKAILNLIHGFTPKGSEGSGEVYFAKYGIARSSKDWNCPTYASCVFFERKLPEKFPTGVLLENSNISMNTWKYDNNKIIAERQNILQTKYETIILKYYNNS